MLSHSVVSDSLRLLVASLFTIRASVVAQLVKLVKNPPAMQKTPVRFLGWEDLLEKG